MVTLKDIAQEAGVSVMTVSRVANGNYTKASKETIERIQKIIKEKKYIPNSSARSLSNKNSQIIAIVLRGDKNQNALQNPYMASLVGTIIHKVQSNGYYTMVSIMKSESDISQNLQTWNIEGAIFIGMFDIEIEKMCASITIPTVFIDSYSSIRRLSNIGIDDYKGGQLAARHFIDSGHKNLAFIGPPTNHTGVVQQRFLGFCDELKANGLSFNPSYQFTVESDVDLNEIDDIGKKIAKNKNNITGAFISSDQIASYLINSLHDNGLKVPEDISLIGFDNLPLCQQLTPPLTTIAQSLDQKACLAVDILFHRLKTPNSPIESMILDVELIERNSVLQRAPFHSKKELL